MNICLSVKFSDALVCPRNTSRNGLRRQMKPLPGTRGQKASGKLTPFEPKLLLALEADARRPKPERRTALRLFNTIKKEGFSGGYTMSLTSSVTGATRLPQPEPNPRMSRSGLSWAKLFSLTGARNGS